MGKPQITGMTISISLSDKTYGTGTESFFSMQGKYPDPAALNSVLVDGLDMYFAAWESLLASRYATGIGTAAEFKQAVEDAKIRLGKIRNFLQKEVQVPSVE
jgi:hypothetical protein